MPDSIIRWTQPGIRRVPSWLPHPGSTYTDSFHDAYHARLSEFWDMSKDDLKAEIARLRTLHKQEGRHYTLHVRAQTYAAEDVLMRHHHVYIESSAYPKPKGPAFVREYPRDPDPDPISREDRYWIRVAHEQGKQRDKPDLVPA